MATLMVLLIFNLKGAGYSIILPRLIDTLLGCFIAWLAVNFYLARLELPEHPQQY